MFGKRFREERERQGLTRKQVAEKMGVTKQAVYYWENEQKKISLENADLLAKALGITMEIGCSNQNLRESVFD